MKTKKLLILYSLLFLLPVIHAQPLKEVVRGTLINNPEIQALRTNTKAYRYYVDEEEGKLYPSINLETFFEELQTERDNQADERQSGTNTQLKLEQTLFDGWLTSSKIEETKKDLKATQYRNSATIEGVILDAVDAYLNVVKNEEFRLLSENNLLIHEDYLQVATEAEEVSGDTLDRMQVESKIFSANAKFSEVKRDALQARATLEKLYGKKVDNNFCRPVIQGDENLNDLEELISEALTVNYSVLEEINKIKTQRAVVSQEKSRFYPTITAKLLHEVDDGVDVKDVKKTENSFRITLSYNIFNGGQDSAIFEREKLFLKESQKSLDNVVNQVIEEVKINYTKFHTAKKRIAYLENYLNKNKDILFVYLEQFEGGTRGFIDILNHEAELFRAKTDLIQEQFTYSLAYYELQNLLSNLSTTVLSSKKQICEEIKVDVERRKLSSKDEDIEADEELAAIFEEGEEAALEESGQNDRDAKVQSMLNQILNEVYNPDSVNRNINVSQISHSVSKDALLPEGDRKDEALKELIKIQQELEEKAIREERNKLKTQIKDAAKSLAEESEKKESQQEENIKLEEVEPQEDESISTQKVKTQKIKEDVIKQAEALNKEEKVLLETQKEKNQTETSTKRIKVEKKEKVLHEFSDDKLLSLAERQAISRKIGAKFKRLFREQNGLDEFGYVKIDAKEKNKTKEETIEELSKSMQKKKTKLDTKTEEIEIIATKEVDKQSEETISQFKKDENVKMVEEKIAENKAQLQSEQSEELQTVKQTQEIISKYSHQKEQNSEAKQVIEKEVIEGNNISAMVDSKKIDNVANKVVLTLEERQRKSRELEKKYKQAYRMQEGLDEFGYSKEYKERILKQTLEAAQKEKEKILKEAQQQDTKEAVSKEKQLQVKKEQVDKSKEESLQQLQTQKETKELALEKERQLQLEKAQRIREEALKKVEVLKEKQRALAKAQAVKEEKSEKQLHVEKKEEKLQNIQSNKSVVKETIEKKVNDNKTVTTSKVKKKLEEAEKVEEKTPLIKTSLKEELLGPKSNKYTLGILTLSKNRKASFIKKHYNLEKNIIVYKSQNNGQTYFKVIYGVYDSAKDAKADIKNLHKTLQKNGVFVNRISTHQKLFKKYNPNGEL